MLLSKFGRKAGSFALRHRFWTQSHAAIYTNTRRDANTPATATSKAVKEAGPGLIIEAVPADEPKKPSFAKQLFAGKFDTDVLTYPEVLQKEEHETLHQMVDLVEKFVEEKGKFL